MNLSTIKDRFSQPHIKMGILVFLIALLSFGVGYIIGRDWTPAPIVIEKTSN